MPRHPRNTNLHLHEAATFEGWPLMEGKGPFFHQHLVKLKRTIDRARTEYPRLLAFRVDLRLPLAVDLLVEVHANDVISRFIRSFKAKIEHDRKVAKCRSRYVHDSKVRYVWAREVGRGERPHYHLLILLNRDAYYTLGKKDSERANIFSRLQEAWASALALSVQDASGLVHIPDNAVYRVDQGPGVAVSEGMMALFQRASYLCKVATKVYGDGHHGFDCSRV